MTNDEDGLRLRDLRAELGLSLREVEERGGPSKDVLSPIERGVHKPRAQTLGKIAQAFEMSVSELRARLEDDAPKARPPLRKDWASSYPDEGFRRAVKEAATEELREAMKGHVGNRPAQDLEDYRRDNASAKAVGEVRVRVFAHALIVDQELRSRGDEPPEDYLPDFREWSKATGLD